MNQLKQTVAYWTLLGLVFIISNGAYAQQRCGTDANMQQSLQSQQFAAEYQALQERVASQLQTKRLQAPCVTPLIVPIVVHFQPTNISEQCMIDATIAQIDQMNADFSGCNMNAGLLCEWINAGCNDFGGTAGALAMPDDGACIQFCLADQNLPADANLISGGLAITTSYNADNQNAPALWNGFLNIYVGPIGGGGILGFVNFLGGASNTNQTQGASVLTSAFGSQNFVPCEGVGGGIPYDGGATLTHEVGHWFGLEHTFGDNIADTPPQTNPNFGCPTVDTNACTSTEGTDYSGNFMDYVDDDCMFSFSQDQVDVMIATAAPQADWASNSTSCMPTYPPCANQAGACELVCPSVVTTPISLTEDACGSTTTTDFPGALSNGLVVDEVSDLVLTWSTGNYLSAGGTVATAPTILTSTNCAVVTETYYLNVDCGTTPLATTLDAGTFVATSYPALPDDIAALVTINNESGCDEPIVAPIAGCENNITVAADTANPSFPVAAGDSGTANYTVTFTSSAAGPECCIIGNPADEGEILVNGDFEAGVAPWIELEEVPAGTPNPNPFGIIGVSGGLVNGSSEAWFGGWGGDSYLTITQDIIIPACNSVELSFDYLMDACGGNTDFIEVQIGGVVIANITCDDTNTTFGPVDILALGVPAGATQIVIIGEENSGANTNIFIDNVSLVASACTEPADCDVVVAANYNCDVTCEDSIAGTISTDTDLCPSQGADFSGIEVIIIDVLTGLPVAGSPAITDATGNYSLAGPFACGQYSAELNLATVPMCYTSLNGETGPVQFTINGDGTADGFNFSNVMMVPTLSQWGLLILALLLMSFGAIKISILKKYKTSAVDYK